MRHDATHGTAAGPGLLAEPRRKKTVAATIASSVAIAATSIVESIFALRRACSLGYRLRACGGGGGDRAVRATAVPHASGDRSKLAATRLAVSAAALLIAILSAALALWLTLVEQQALPCDDVAAWVHAHETADGDGPVVAVRVYAGDEDDAAGGAALELRAWAAAIKEAGAASSGSLRIAARYDEGAARRARSIHDGGVGALDAGPDAAVDVKLLAHKCGDSGANVELTVAPDGALTVSRLPCGANAVVRAHVASAIVAGICLYSRAHPHFTFPW